MYPVSLHRLTSYQAKSARIARRYERVISGSPLRVPRVTKKRRARTRRFFFWMIRSPVALRVNRARMAALTHDEALGFEDGAGRLYHLGIAAQKDVSLPRF